MKDRTRQYHALVNWIVNEGIHRGLGHPALEDAMLSGRVRQKGAHPPCGKIAL